MSKFFHIKTIFNQDTILYLLVVNNLFINMDLLANVPVFFLSLVLTHIIITKEAHKLQKAIL